MVPYTWLERIEAVLDDQLAQSTQDLEPSKHTM